MSLAAFVLAIGLLVTVHEWGHYRVAVACGVRVLKFSIGFGRPLWRWEVQSKHGGQATEFCLGWIPLGGYVKMLEVDAARVSAHDWPHAFNRQRLLARAAIVCAGPCANVLLAVFLYATVFWVGQAQTQPILAAPVTGSIAEVSGQRSGDIVLRVATQAQDWTDILSLEDLYRWLLRHSNDAVYLEVKSQTTSARRQLYLQEVPVTAVFKMNDPWQSRGFTGGWSRPVLGDIQADSPAAKAGLMRGDEVLRINRQELVDGPSVRQTVRDSGRDHAPVVQVWDIVRAGTQMSLNVLPEQRIEAGQPVGRIGAQVGEPTAKVWVSYGLWDSWRKAVFQTLDVAGMTLEMFKRLLFGQASWDHLAGPISLADYAGRSADLGWGPYLGYLALVSVSIGVFNLLPLPMLDGGHLLYYLYEACTGRPPSPEWLDALQRVGLATLLALMLVSLFNDVIRLGWLS